MNVREATTKPSNIISETRNKRNDGLETLHPDWHRKTAFKASKPTIKSSIKCKTTIKGRSERYLIAQHKWQLAKCRCENHFASLPHFPSSHPKFHLPTYRFWYEFELHKNFFNFLSFFFFSRDFFSYCNNEFVSINSLCFSFFSVFPSSLPTLISFLH